MQFQRDFVDADWDEVRLRQLKRVELVAEWISLTQMEQGKTVLDVGPGPGVFTLEYAKAVGTHGRVFALEKAETAISYLHDLVAQSGLSNVILLAGDGEEGVDVSEPLDIVMLTDVLHHTDGAAALLHNVARTLRGDAVLLIAEFDPAAPGEYGPPLEARLAAAEVERLALAEGLRVIARGRQPHEHYFLKLQRAS